MARAQLFSSPERGAGMIEVLLALAIIAASAPFVYQQIARTNAQIKYLATARRITNTRADVLNYVRINSDTWPNVAQIKLSDDELHELSDIASAGFIDKYVVRGAIVTDVYLAFDFDANEFSVANVANQIGPDAAIVGADGIAYGNTWAVTAPDFAPGNLIYRISRDASDVDNTKYLHRGTSGEDGLNTMQRDLNMGGNDVYNVGGVVAKSAKVRNASATFVNADDMSASAIYFSGGANMDGGDVTIGTMRVTGDVIGFRNINADKLNGSSYTTSGHIITDRATVENSVNVARDFIIKSDSLRTISAFTGINVNSVVAPFISVEEIIFYENFGLTVSGELLMSTTAPIKIGSWSFPSTTPPKFSELTLVRASVPSAPSNDEFGAVMGADWKISGMGDIR